MSALALIDLSVSKDLDAKAMASIKGGDEYSYIRSTTTLSAWGASVYNGQTYYGQLFRNGYLHRHYVRSWSKSRTETQTDYWNFYQLV
jgi:hypothetical protein